MHCCVAPQTFNSRTVRDGANCSFLPCACGRVPRGGVRWTVYSATARDRRYNGERCTRMHDCMVALLGGPSISPHAGMHEEPTRSWHPHPFCVEGLVVASLCHQRVRLLPLHITTTVSNCMCMSGSVRVTVRLTPDFGLHNSAMHEGGMPRRRPKQNKEKVPRSPALTIRVPVPH